MIWPFIVIALVLLLAIAIAIATKAKPCRLINYSTTGSLKVPTEMTDCSKNSIVKCDAAITSIPIVGKGTRFNGIFINDISITAEYLHEESCLTLKVPDLVRFINSPIKVQYHSVLLQFQLPSKKRYAHWMGKIVHANDGTEFGDMAEYFPFNLLDREPVKLPELAAKNADVGGTELVIDGLEKVKDGESLKLLFWIYRAEFTPNAIRLWILDEMEQVVVFDVKTELTTSGELPFGQVMVNELRGGTYRAMSFLNAIGIFSINTDLVVYPHWAHALNFHGSVDFNGKVAIVETIQPSGNVEQFINQLPNNKPATQTWSDQCPARLLLNTTGLAF